jgi:CHAT domain-containing protein/tetratricopeptide (TPR) repeat protein
MTALTRESRVLGKDRIVFSAWDCGRKWSVVLSVRSRMRSTRERTKVAVVLAVVTAASLASLPTGAIKTNRAVDRLLAVADSLSNSSSFDAAVEMLDEALVQARADEDSVAQGRILADLSLHVKNAGRAADAEPLAAQARALAAALSDSALWCKALLHEALAADAQGRPPRAVEMYEQLIALAEAAGQMTFLARGELYLSRRVASGGDLDRARDLVDRALTRFAALGLENDETRAIFQRGLLHARKGELDKARERWMDALARSKRLAMRSLEGLCLNNLGRLEISLGQVDSAAERWRRAYELLSERRNYRGAAVAAFNAAMALKSRGRYGEAIELLEEQLAITIEQGATDYQSGALQRLGEVHQAMGKHSSAVEFYRRALVLVAGTDKVMQRTTALKGLAYSLAAMDSLDRALAASDELWELRPRTGREVQIQIAGQRAELLVQARRYEEALPLLEDARADLMEMRFARYWLDNLAWTADAYRGLSRADSALVYYRRAVDIWESDRRASVDPEWREIRGGKGALVYTQLADLILAPADATPSPAQLREAYDLLQRFKARTLLERVLGPAIWQSAEEATEEAVTLAMVQTEYLEEGELLLDAFVGPSTSFLFAVTRRDCRLVRLQGNRGGLRPQVEFYRRLVSDGSSARGASGLKAIERAGSEIGAVFLAEISDLLDGCERVLFAPDGILDLVPLAAMGDASTDHRPLLVDREVVYIPSASLLGALRGGTRRDSSAATRVLAVAGRANADGSPLEGARHEVRELGRRYQNVFVSENGEMDFSIEELSGYDLLHFAAHITTDDQHPWRSGIALAGSDATTTLRAGAPGIPKASILRAGTIASLELPAQLAVLSGCASAGGAVLSGEGVLGLSSAFLSAGVPSVIATLWPVDDGSTSALMREFYAGLARGETVSSALQAAQMMLRDDPATAHPFHWAGFVVIGDGQLRLGLTTRTNRMQGAIAAGLLLLAAMGVVVAWRLRGRMT